MASTFKTFLETVRPQVNERIGNLLDAEPFDPDLAPLLLRGKRLRAGVLMLAHRATAEATGYTVPGRDAALDLAAAIELVHGASLIVDDMVDGDTVRRGVPTRNAGAGTAVAMLDAIGTLSLAHTLAATCDAKGATMYYSRTLAEVQRRMVAGALAEAVGRDRMKPWEYYQSVIHNKTARLFGLAAGWGMYAGYPPDTELFGSQEFVPRWRTWWTYGVNVGRGMQIADDHADIRHLIGGEGSPRPGSEMLLVRAWMDREAYANLLITLKAGKPHRGLLTTWYEWGGIAGGIQKAIHASVKGARNVLTGIPLPTHETMLLLQDAPEAIAKIMLEEEDTCKPTISTTT